MDLIQHSFDHYGLHRAATAGDDDAVERALDMGADVNGLDAAGRTAIMCAVAGEHWQNVDASDASFMTPQRLNAIRILARHPNTTLLTLNAPQSPMNGVVPLGMAAWLNRPDAVRMLLKESKDTVCVDGMDAHGATALMYAARDGSLDVVQLLLSHGARPDFRDCNHRTSIQFALPHPQILWLCESVLRRHRWRESHSADKNKLFPDSERLLQLSTSSLPSDSHEPPPLSIFTNHATSRLTDTLVSSVFSSDLSFLQSLLFSPPLPPSSPPTLYPMSVPVLINHLDAQGWAPIHYCVSADHLSIQMLDSLYCAGAEISLFTADEHFTPLHILARSAKKCAPDSPYATSLYQFTVHLIRDLRAPLSARDRNDETCIHIAAEHGRCVDLLMTLLECDSTGRVRELRNSRGLTALDVAKPEFRAVFGMDVENLRPVSSLSSRTIRQTESFASLVSFSDWKPAVLDDTASLFSPSDFNFEGSTQQLLQNLRATSLSVHHRAEPGHIDRLDVLVTEASRLKEGILGYFRSQVENASKELEELRSNADKISLLLDIVSKMACDKLGGRGCASYLRSKTRDSEDSQYTAVSSIMSFTNSSTSSVQVVRPRNPEEGYTSVAVQTTPLESPPTRSTTWVYWPESSVAPPDPVVYRTHLAHLAEIDHELSFFENSTGSPAIDARIKQLIKKRRKIEEKLKEIEGEKKRDTGNHGASKLKAWIKRIITHEKTMKLDIVKDIDERNCAVGREVKSWTLTSIHYLNTFDAYIDGALQTSQFVLSASFRDLLTIQQCLNSADQFITLANHAISRAERVIKRALKKREDMIANLRAPPATLSDDGIPVKNDHGNPDALGYSLSLRPSVASFSSVSSSNSSSASIVPTLIENDDEDTRAIRRLLMRKIEATIMGSWDEMDKVMGWLRILKEVVRGVKRRAYL